MVSHCSHTQLHTLQSCASLMLLLHGMLLCKAPNDHAFSCLCTHELKGYLQFILFMGSIMSVQLFPSWLFPFKPLKQASAKAE